MDDDSAVAFADALKENKTLKVLGLHSNKIGDKGAIALADMLLAQNTTLTTLALQFNAIGEEGTDALLRTRATVRVLVKNSDT